MNIVPLETLTVFWHRRSGLPLEQRVKTRENERPDGDGWKFVHEEYAGDGRALWVWSREVRA